MSDLVVTGWDLIAGVEAQLRAELDSVVEALGYDDLGRVAEYQVVPEMDAIASAQKPAIAIGAVRIVTQPFRSGDVTYTGTWQISVGIFDRGKDHADTQSRINRWAAAIRVAVLLGGSLGGLASTAPKWVSEEFSLIPDQSKARTLAGAEVMFDITTEGAVNLPAIRALITPGPEAESVHPEITLN